jgi:hypothetical protein
MLDPAAPALLDPAFAATLAALEEADGLAHFRFLPSIAPNIIFLFQDDQLLNNKDKEYFHAMLGATLVSPGHDKVPLPPEFIAPQDGAEKQDCENPAAERWLAIREIDYARLDPIYLGDDLVFAPALIRSGACSGGRI